MGECVDGEEEIRRGRAGRELRERDFSDLGVRVGVAGEGVRGIGV